MRVLALGATGMLGNAMLRSLAESQDMEVLGTIRSEEGRTFFPRALADRLVVTPDVQDHEHLIRILREIRPDTVINCISPSRESLNKGDPLEIIPLCALLPHRLSAICLELDARLVHISTDGVFSGRKGAYTEDDLPDATDVYGISKYLGEVDSPHAITLRTSMFGHEVRGFHGLLEWFLSQEEQCRCFSRAVFSGLPTAVLATIVRDVVIPRSELSGIYHVAAQPITKCELLRLIAEAYGKPIEIVPDDAVSIDRSLSSERFRKATGYVAPDWPTLIQTMHSSR